MALFAEGIVDGATLSAEDPSPLPRARGIYRLKPTKYRVDLTPFLA